MFFSLLKFSRILKRVCFLLLVFYFIIMVLALTSWADKRSSIIDVPSYTSFLASDLDKKKPAKQFSCTNPIYLHFAWYLLEGSHQVNVFWINPGGKEENQVQLKFIAEKKITNNWVALKFKNIFDEINPLTPNLKAEKFSGKWKVRIFLDRKLLETLDFSVYC